VIEIKKKCKLKTGNLRNKDMEKAS